MVLKCPYCGNSVREIDEVCDKCGRRMSELGVGNRTCLSCGKMYDWYAEACPHCGAKTVSTSIGPPSRMKKDFYFLFWHFEVYPDSETAFLRQSRRALGVGAVITVSRRAFFAQSALLMAVFGAVIALTLYESVQILGGLTWAVLLPVFFPVLIFLILVAYVVRVLW
jgi:hypothetical protein